MAELSINGRKVKHFTKATMTVAKGSKQVVCDLVTQGQVSCRDGSYSIRTGSHFSKSEWLELIDDLEYVWIEYFGGQEVDVEE